MTLYNGIIGGHIGKNRWITKFKIDEKDGNYYPTYGHKIHSGSIENDVILL